MDLIRTKSADTQVEIDKEECAIAAYVAANPDNTDTWTQLSEEGRAMWRRVAAAVVCSEAAQRLHTVARLTRTDTATDVETGEEVPVSYGFTMIDGRAKWGPIYAIQDPKYVISHNRLINSSSLVAIPKDEGVFLMRFKDEVLVDAMYDYLKRLRDPTHREAVGARLQEAIAFRARNPLVMKQPDTHAPQLPGV